MPVLANRMTENDVASSMEGPTWCFPATQSDTEYLIDPNPVGDEDVGLVSAAISLSAEDDVKVEFWNGRIATIPSGTLKAGVRYKLHIVKVFATGTGAVEVLIWRGDSLRNLNPTSY